MPQTAPAPKPYSTVAFYGIDPSPDAAAAAYHTFVQWFTALGHPPDKLAVGGPGFGGKPGSFARISARLRTKGFAGVKDLSLYRMIPGGQVPIMDYLLTAEWAVSGSYSFLAASASLATLTSASMLPVAQALARILKPAYGIGFTRDLRLGPALYAVGLCQGLGPDGYGVDLSAAEEAEAESISRWCDAMEVQAYRKGLVRDVYPWNFLTQPHLNVQIDGLPLQEWMGRDAQRGRLIPLDAGVVLWTVDDAHVPDIRLALQSAGAVFDWRKHL